MNASPTTPPVSSFPRWQQALIGFPGILISGLWGFAEATFFFIIPDVFLSLVAVLQWPRTWKHVLSAVVGAVVGGALLFLLAAAIQQNARAAVIRVPFIREHMLANVDDGFRHRGLYALLWGSLEGVPYKLYAVEAPRFTRESRVTSKPTAPHKPSATPPARAIRFLLVWSAFGCIAAWLRARFTLRTAYLLMIYSLTWIVVYAFYWGRILSS